METITSIKNPVVAAMRALKEKKTRDERGRFLVEGRVMILEALSCGLTPDVALMDEEDAPLLGALAEAGARVYLSPRHVVEAVCETKTPQGACAAFSHPKQMDESARGLCRLVALDAVQDPGNCGAIWRCADAAGFHGLIFGQGSADALSPKVQRAAMGSGFRLPARFGEELIPFLSRLRAEGYQIIVSLLSGDDLYARPAAGEKFVLVIGNEARGVRPEIAAMADIRLKIPMRGGAESLNAAVAAGILMYELTRK